MIQKLIWITGLLLLIAISGCHSVHTQRDLIQANYLQSKGHNVAALRLYVNLIKENPHNAELKKKYLLLRESMLSNLIDNVKKRVINKDYSGAEDIVYHTMEIVSDWTAGQKLIDLIISYQKDDEEMDKASFFIEEGDYLQASHLVARVLRHQPGHKEANYLKQNLDKIWQDGVNTNNVLDERFFEIINIEYYDVPLRTLFDTLSSIINVSFFFDQDIDLDSIVSMQFYDMTAYESLKIFFKTHQLEYQILAPNSLLIFPVTPQKIREYQEISVRVFQIIHIDPNQIADTLSTVLKIKDMSVDPRNGLIIIRDTPAIISSAEKIIHTSDRPEAEVDLEMDIIEVNRSRLMSLGINWPDQLNMSPYVLTDSRARALLKDLASSLSGGSWLSTLPTLEVSGRDDIRDTNVIANPRIRVRNKEKAEIQIGDRYPLVGSVTTSSGSKTDTISFVDVGLRLEVEPTISLENSVSIKLNLEVSSLSNKSSTSQGNPVYQIGNRSVNTVLRLQDGETQVIAGLIKNDVKNYKVGIPFLSKIPIIRRLFGRGEDESNKTEIILSITPHIVYSRQRLTDIESQFDITNDYFVSTPWEED